MQMRVGSNYRTLARSPVFKTGSYQPLSRVHSLYITGQAGYIEVNGKYKSFIGKIYPYAINYS